MKQYRIDFDALARERTVPGVRSESISHEGKRVRLDEDAPVTGPPSFA